MDKCTAVWFIKLPRQWIYGSLEVFVFLEESVAIIVTHMWTPTTPARTPALLNIDKQSQKGKKNNKHKSSWLHSGCFGGGGFLTVKEAAAILQANKQCLERSLSINAPLTYLSANIYHEIGEAARLPKQTRSSRDWVAPPPHSETPCDLQLFSISMRGYVHP